jgi:ApaG protein
MDSAAGLSWSGSARVSRQSQVRKGSVPVPQTQAQIKTRKPESRGSDVLTHGIRVQVRPKFVEEQSDPGARQWMFSYRIRISNEGDKPAQLMTRRWDIVDGSGRHEQVKGPGVVGQQPRLEPGRMFEYSSFCQLRTNWGTMEGAYQFRTEDAATFDVAIARFYLVGPEARRR